MEKDFNEQDSLRMINEMISTAKGNIRKGAGKHFILWGYLVCVTSIAHFLLNTFASPITGGYGVIWLPVTIIGFVVSFIMGYRDSRKARVVTYADAILSRIWIGFIVCLLLIMTLLSGKIGWYVYPAIAFIYTFAIYISAVVFKSKWMYFSVLICCICTISHLYVPFNYYPLLMALLMIVGNIAPGHHLNYKAKQQANV